VVAAGSGAFYGAFGGGDHDKESGAYGDEAAMGEGEVVRQEAAGDEVVFLEKPEDSEQD